MRTACAALVAAALLLLTSRGQAAGDVILRAAAAPVIQGNWVVTADPTAAGGARLWNPDRGAPKLTAALAAPADYFELTFDADAGTPYHLWLRARAQDDGYWNDSVYVQFSDTVTSSGAATWRIGTTSSTTVVLEDCDACGESGWGWQDNAYGALAGSIYFATSGTHTIRIQVREDGLSIDQLVISPGTYLSTSPGTPTNDTTVLAGGAVPPPSPSLVRGPYLQQVRDRSAVVVWATRDPGPASVQVGSQVVSATTTFFGSGTTGIADYYQHEAAIAGLQPGTTYAYTLSAGAVAITSGADRLTTAPETGTGRVRFIAFGDSGTGSPEQAGLAGRMSADSFDLALHAGDLAYGNSGGTGDASYGTYQSWFFDVYSWLRRRPVFPSMGNHDSRSSNGWGQAYLDLFSLPAAAGWGPYPDHAERYYSFDYGPIHFVALDTELAFQDPSRRAAQLAWLDADLSAAASQPWKIAVFHRSPYSAGGEHGSDLDVRQAFGPLFEKHGVQISVSAHEHIYERSVPWRVGAAGSNHAVTYVVTGGGGGPLYPAGRNEWTAVSASEHHYLRVAVDGCVSVLEAVRADGSLLDSASLDRCAQDADAAAPSIDFASLSGGMTVSGQTVVDALASDDRGVQKVDLWVDGALYGSDAAAPYSFTWDATAYAAGSHTLELRAYDIAGNRNARAIAVTTAVGGSGGSSGSLPAGWLSQDIGAVSLAGSASANGGVFTIDGSGTDIWGTADAFRYAYRPLDGDGTIVARVSWMSGSEAWMKAGVMIRASTASDAAHASMFVSLGKGLAFQRRTASGAGSLHTAGPAAAAPYWVRLTRTGNVFTASVSPDGQTWVTVGSEAIAMPAHVLAGLAVTSHNASAISTAAFDQISISGGSALPLPWQSADVGAVGVAGDASASSGAYVVRGAGADIWGTADAFHFAWRTLDGDGSIVARVTGLEGTQSWTKAGVMMRDTLDPGSAHAYMLVSAAKGLAFQRRTTAGGLSTNTAAAAGAPRWIRLVRQGPVVAASTSTDGANWTEVGRDTFALGQTIAVGLAVTNHDASQLATGSFDNVTVTPGF